MYLPKGSNIHYVFHVLLLKRHKGPQHQDEPALPPVLHGTFFSDKPLDLLKENMRGGNRQLLVKWTKDVEDDSTWEDVEKLLEAYPEVEHEDKLLVEEESNDTRYDITYQCRKSKT